MSVSAYVEGIQGLAPEHVDGGNVLIWPTI